MVKVIDSSTFARRGNDVMDWTQLNHAKPEEYMITHMLGNASRTWRRRMYFEMLKQALWARNDTLAVYAFQKYILFIERKKETSTEYDYWEHWGTSPLWPAEKEQAAQKLWHRVLCLCRAVLNNPGLYKKVKTGRFGGLNTIETVLPETWKHAVKVAVGILHDSSKSNYRRFPKDEKLIREAYSLVWDAYCTLPAQKAFNVTSHTPIETPSNELLEILKNSVNLMDLEQVIYFLELYPNMHRNFLSIFRFQYIRKGGAIDLKGTPLKV